MSNKQIPETSLAAYRSLDPVRLSETHKAIVEALKVINVGNYEGIAKQMGMPESKVWKRLHEVVKAGLIYNTGETIQTKNGCKSYLYMLTDSLSGPFPIPKKVERVMKGNPVQDFSRAINQVAMSPITQITLF